MLPPLVLLHGWGVNSQIWNPLVSALQSSFKVHVIDLPGFGDDVNYAGEYLLPAIVDRVMKAAPVQAYWVAWSLGATVAMQAALQQPQRFLKLQLVSATPRFMLDTDWEFGMQPEPLKELSNLFDFSYKRGLKKFLLLQTTNREIVRSQIESILQKPNPTSESLHRSLDLLANTDLRTSIDQLRVETQVVVGEADQIVSPLASHWLANAIPSASIVAIDGHTKGHIDSAATAVGHLPFLENPAAFLTNLFAFTGVATR